MKLKSAQVERTLSQFQGEAIPDNHPAVPQLNNVFGEHTFFLDRNGLNIVEPASAAGGGSQWAKVRAAIRPPQGLNRRGHRCCGRARRSQAERFMR